MQKTFTKINTNDLVFDHNSKQKGKVIHIDHKANTAKVEVIVKEEVVNNERLRTTKVIFCKLDDLQVTKSAPKVSIDPNRMYHAVRTFQRIFGHPVADTPKPMTLKRAVDRAVWTAEEVVAEFIHVSASNDEEYRAAQAEFMKRLEEAFDDQLSKPYPQNDTDRLVDQADALGDGYYLTSGSYVEIGIKPANIFEAIQKANMSKLDADGNVVYKPDGKIGKSNLFAPPEADIKEEVIRQQMAAMNKFDKYEKAE